MTKPLKIMLSGGGSGGPVTPLLTVAKELSARHHDISFIFVGGHVGPEIALVTEASKTLPIIFVPILSGKFRRYFSWRNVTDIFNIGGAFVQSLYLLRKERPDLVMSAGAFVSVPLVWAAKTLSIPVLIHQQDVLPGLANRLMARAANIVTVTFKESLKIYGSKAVLTGNPFICPELTSKADIFKNFNLDINLPLILVFGGGTGARAINEAVVNNLDKLLAFTQVIHLSGGGKNISANRAGYSMLEFLPHQQILSVMAAADLIVARSGLATITELSALQKPSILIPMPGTHQEANANICRDQGAAVVLKQANLNNELPLEVHYLLVSEEKKKALAKAMASINQPGAVTKITDLALSLVK